MTGTLEVLMAHASVNGHRPGVPGIDADERNAPLAAVSAWAALLGANAPAQFFRYGDTLVRLERAPDGTPLPRLLTLDRLRHHLDRAARFYVVTKKGEEKPALAPEWLARDMLATPDPPLPRLVRVVEVPIFTPAGAVLSRPGYDPESGVLFAPPPGFVCPPVPEEPTGEDITQARALFLGELLRDFPFTGPGERAQAVAMLLEPFTRDLIDGPTPLYLIEKPSPGTGASLLAELAAHITTGRPGSAMTEGRDEDEWRKRITAKLMTGAPIILLDNLRRRLDSAAVASAITAAVWEDRMLGQSEMVRIRVRCTWIATGNNPSLSAEMVRRAVRIRLDAKIDRPWLRDVAAFRHPDLRAWVHRSRADLAWAALVLGQAWIARGRPAPDVRQLGMFESWSQVMGGILATAGIPGFLANLDEFYTTTDAEGGEVRAFLAAWWDKHRDGEVTAAQLFTLATSPDSALDIDAKTEQGRKVRFGKLLSDLRDRRYRLADHLVVTVAQAGTHNRAVLWTLRAETGGAEETQRDSYTTPTEPPAHESMSLYESVPPLRVTRAREEPIGAGKTHQDSETHSAKPETVPEWVTQEPDW